MKRTFHNVPVSIQNSLWIKHHFAPNFGNLWHFHPELELHYVLRGEGVRLIGDHISNFSAGEILLLGENLPHTFRYLDEYHQQDANVKAETIVLKFLPEGLGRDWFSLPEAYLIPRLFENAKKGMLITGKTRERVAKMMQEAVSASPMQKLILLLSMLTLLSETEEYTALTSASVVHRSTNSDIVRLNDVYAYTLTNYKKEITLEEIATISNLSITSFCRYFKMMTKKTYYDFLIEIRISHACRMLVANQVPTVGICFDCGFNNVSNFYRHFRRVTGMTPMYYKRKHHLN